MTESFSTDKQKLIQRELRELVDIQQDTIESQRVIIKKYSGVLEKHREYIQSLEKTLKSCTVTTIAFGVTSALCLFTLIF